jgi:predicted AAA+ superfamily ATPase
VQDISAFCAANAGKLIILDEVQRLPDIFAPLRGVIDAYRRAGNRSGQFLFLGSASIALMKQTSESLAGRISYLELQPVDLIELQQQDISIDTLWLRGGYPDSLLAPTDSDSLTWRYDLVRTYLERDIPQLGPRIPAETLSRFWTMLANQQGGTLNAAQIGRSLDTTNTTIIRYLDLMVDLLLVRRLQPYATNLNKRIIRAPKVYIRDSGICHSLLTISDHNQLVGHPASGGSWEGFVIENLMSVAPPLARPYFYRTQAGAEIDLILEFGADERWAIEIKRSSVPKLSKGFHVACADIAATRKFVVYAGNDSFTMLEDVQAVPLVTLMKEILNR